jgi:hypothetical protein
VANDIVKVVTFDSGGGEPRQRGNFPDRAVAGKASDLSDRARTGNFWWRPPRGMMGMKGMMGMTGAMASFAR